MENKIKLGTKVASSEYLSRTIDYKTKFRYWKRRKQNINGIYIGYRTYQNGKLYYDPEEGTIFIPEEYIKIALIVTNERQNPIPVLYSEIKLNTLTNPTEKDDE